MSENNICRAGPAAVLRSYTDSRFKTMKLSVNMLVPLKRDTAALYGILPGLVTRATKEYPDLLSLNRRLSELYGASLSAGVRRIGGFHCLSLGVEGISSRYAFGGEDMLEELSQILYSALFSPLKGEDGLFPEEHFRQEKRQLLELKEAELSDKISYAHQQCEALLFAGKEWGVDRYGTKEDVEALAREPLSEAWDKLLSSAQFEIVALGDCAPRAENFQHRFAQVGTPQTLGALPFEAAEEVRRKTEQQPLSQSKLSMGFRVNAKPEERRLYQLMSAVWGGTPSSKLFLNVREKMGLCYYCSSSYSPLSRALYVESGVETENLQKAENEILNQLYRLQNGEVTDEELLSAKLSLCNSFRSVGDSLNAMASWCLSGAFSAEEETLDQAAQKVMACTKDQVIEAAGKVQLQAVYRLEGRGGK